VLVLSIFAIRIIIPLTYHYPPQLLGHYQSVSANTFITAMDFKLDVWKALPAEGSSAQNLGLQRDLEKDKKLNTTTEIRKRVERHSEKNSSAQRSSAVNTGLQRNPKEDEKLYTKPDTIPVPRKRVEKYSGKTSLAPRGSADMDVKQKNEKVGSLQVPERKAMCDIVERPAN
jgi:hypothetical protein